MKNCEFTPKGSKESYSYDDFRAYLLENPAWWGDTAMKFAPSALGGKAVKMAAEQKGAAKTPPPSPKKVEENKVVLNKVTQRIKAGFDAITKAMGINTKVQFLSEAEARKMIATSNDLKKLIAGYNMTKNDLQAAVNFGIANELEAKGVSPLDIKLQTGWERGADKMWKYEIGDAKIKKSIINEIIGTQEEMFEEFEISEEEAEEKYTLEYKLKDFIGATGDLFKKYPEAKDINIKITPLNPYSDSTQTGNFDVKTNTITLNLIAEDPSSINIDDLTGTLNHEIQHFIQLKENFGFGGNSDMFVIDDNSSSAPTTMWNLYQHLAGETEARNVQKRIGMSAAEKLRTLLEETEGIPRINQIVNKYLEKGRLVEGVDFTIGENGEITPGASDDWTNYQKNFNWKSLDSDYVGDMDYLKTPDGKILGFVRRLNDGTYQIYIDPTTVGAETPIHEIAGHIFLPIIKQVAPELYNKGAELVKGSEYESRLKERGYGNQSKADAVEEALAQAIGDRGAKLTGKVKSDFMDWLKSMWQKVGGVLKLNITPEKLQNMKLGEFADFIAGSIIYGQEISEMEASPLVAPPGNTTMSVEKADALITEGVTEITQALEASEDAATTARQTAYRTQAAGKIAKSNIIDAIKEDVKEYLTKGMVGIQKYTGAAKEFIKSVGDQIKKKAIIAVIVASGIIGTAKAMGNTSVNNMANAIRTELVNTGIMSPAVAKASLPEITATLIQAQRANESQNKGKEPSPFEPAQAIFFGLAIPLATRKKVLDAIRGKSLDDAKEAALNAFQEDGISEDMIEPVMLQIEERYEAKSEAEHLADHIDRLKAASKLTAAQAKQLMHHFRNFLQGPEDLAEAMEFVTKLAEKKNLMEKLSAARNAFTKLKSLSNSKKLTIFDKTIARKLGTPKFYLLSEAEMDKVIEMAKDFYDSRLSEKKPKFTADEMQTFFDSVSNRQARTKGPRKIKPSTLSMLQFKVASALGTFANTLPIAKELQAQDLSVLGKDKDTLIKILNALKAFEETGLVFDLGGILQTVKALNDAKKIRSTPIISTLKRLAAGGISTKLQMAGINADEVRRILFGGWDRNAARVTAENNKQRLDIDVKFDKLNINLADRFVLGAYAFFKELSGNQSSAIKASVLANQMNELNSKIENAKLYGSSASKVDEYAHYYKGATEALSKLGVISLVGNNWVANPNFDIETANIPDNVKAAWEYSRQILDEKHSEYLKAMQEYHGRDFDEIEGYWPRTFLRTEQSASDIQDASAQLPAIGGFGGGASTQASNVAGRNKGRDMMPNKGGFYVLDGYENLINGLWDINATINLSKEYAYTNALINKTVLLDNVETNKALKDYMISSISGILKDPLLFVDTRNDWEKAASIAMNAATQTVLNNFTQLIKQPMALFQGFVTNPKASFNAVTLMVKATRDPALQEAINKFYNNTSEPYTSQLAHIEMETAYQVQPNKYAKKVKNALDFITPQSLIRANRFTQRVLLLSEYMAERGYGMDGAGLMKDAKDGFDATALAAAENNAEAANSTANRHFLPMELKDAKAYKKFLYFLGTYTFVAVNEFFNNINIIRSPGYTGYQKRVAWTQATGFIVQQIMFQVASKAIMEGLKEIGRELDWLEEEDPEKKQERRDKYWYQVPGQVLGDIATGWLPSFWGQAIKNGTNTVVELLQDGYADEENVKDKVELLFKKTDEYPGPLGIIAPMFEQMYKAVESKDQQSMVLAMGQMVAMSLQMGDAYYILKMKAQSVKSLLSAEGNEETFKAMRQESPSNFKSYVDEVRRAGVPDAVLHYMAWKEGETGYYVKASEAEQFYKQYQEYYEEEYKTLKDDGEIKSEIKLKQKARNAAGLSAQRKFSPVEITLPTKE